MTTNVQTADFAKLWSDSSRQVYAFILTVLPNWADADEAFQETGKVLWEKFADFQPGTDFTAWACRAAFISAMEVRRRKLRGPMAFSDAFVEAVQHDFAKHSEVLNARHAALVKCMQKLSVNDRELLRRRYKSGGSTLSAAGEVHRTVNAVYKALNRIHEALFQCIERTLRQEGAK